MSVHDVDGIAFTRGPGIGGCLSVGANAAKTLAAALRKPLVGVHHMQAHALTPFLTEPAPPRFPFLTLLISGGHTMLLLASGPEEFELLAESADESIGNTFDKVARMIGLPPSGAALEEFCSRQDLSDAEAIVLPLPCPGELKFSYAGLRSAVTRHFNANFASKVSPSWSPAPHHPTLPITQYVERPTDPAAVPGLVNLARAFQAAAADQLVEKLGLALKVCEAREVAVTSLVLSGGVASNLYLRARLQDYLDKTRPMPVVFPPVHLCTDNAAMIAWASMPRFERKQYDDYGVELRASWPLHELNEGPA